MNPELNESERAILLRALDVIKEMRRDSPKRIWISAAIIGLQNVLEVGPNWQEDGE